MRELDIFVRDNGVSRTFKVMGRGVLRGSDPNFMVEFRIERQNLGKQIQLRVGDAVVFGDLEPPARRELSLAIKAHCFSIILDRVREVALQAVPEKPL